MNEQIKKEAEEVRVSWRIYADVECLKCGHDNDFTSQDEWYRYCNTGETVEKFWRPFEMECEK